MISVLAKYAEAVRRTDPVKYTGTVTRVSGMLIESRGPGTVVGGLCRILLPSARRRQKPSVPGGAPSFSGTPVFTEPFTAENCVLAEVIGLNGSTVQMMSFTGTGGIEIGCPVIALDESLSVPAGDFLLGRVLDGLGRAADGKGEIFSAVSYPAVAPPPDPMRRRPIDRRMVTGIKAIDAMLAVGKGQRLGIFSGSGVGKSTLLGMIARNTAADVNVIALIGERGREVLDFIQRDLGESGLARSVIVSATSDQSPLMRLRGAYVATAVAEYFRDQGKDVMLMFDSVTRFAKAQREISLARGEKPAQRGYPPSVFETLPRLLERAGTSAAGSITAFYTVLVDGDDMDEPIADTVRGILDCHIVLSRRLAQRYHYPAIDVLSSISRLSKRVSGENTKKAEARVRRLMAVYAEQEDMINVGAYQKGTNPEIDAAIDSHPAIEDFLTQETSSGAPVAETLRQLAAVSGVEIPEEEYDT